MEDRGEVAKKSRELTTTIHGIHIFFLESWITVVILSHASNGAVVLHVAFSNFGGFHGSLPNSFIGWGRGARNHYEYVVG